MKQKQQRFHGAGKVTEEVANPNAEKKNLFVSWRLRVKYFCFVLCPIINDNNRGVR